MVFTFALNSFSTELPSSVNEYVLSKFPKATIRFDGMITLPDDTIYLPIFPSYLDKVEKLEVVYTYPSKTDFKKTPELIVFNNNFSLLKLIKTKNGILTVCQSADIPLVVKTGVLPQDILVPRGLVFPEILKTVLGDVNVPLLTDTNVVPTPQVELNKSLVVQTVSTENGKGSTTAGLTKINPKLANKIYYVGNYDSQLLGVYSSSSPTPKYSLKIGGAVKQIVPVCDGKFLLVMTNQKKQIDVIDVQNEYIAKQIDLSVIPSEMVVDNATNRLFVVSSADKSIFVVDLSTMKIKEKINIIGVPEKLVISENGQQLAYSDRDTSNLYVLRLDGTYANKLVTNVSNVSKLYLKENKLYALIRTDNMLVVNDFDLDRDLVQEAIDIRNNWRPLAKDKKSESLLLGVLQEAQAGMDYRMTQRRTLIETPKFYSTKTNKISLGNKPTDIFVYNDKMFILCSQNNEVCVFDIAQQQLEKTIKLPTSGFSRKFISVPGSNMVVITNVAAKKYILFDLSKQSVIQAVNINSCVHEMGIVEKL